MNSRIVKVEDRRRIKPRRDPYFARISRGQFVGFRKMDAQSPGTWSARYYDEATKKYVPKSLGDLANFPEGQRYDEAVRLAREWFQHLGRGGSPTSPTVRSACDMYLDHLDDSKGSVTATEVRGRFERYVYSNPAFAGLELDKLRASHIGAWRRDLKQMPLASGRNAGSARSSSALNRDMTPLRAALNFAYKKGLATSDLPWKTELAPVSGADGRREIYFTEEQRRALIEHAQPALRPLLRAMCMLPVRPGALSELTVSDFDPRFCVLTVRRDKAGAGRKISLPPDKSDFIEKNCQGKQSDEPIFTNDAGRKWNKDNWGYHFAKALRAANLPDATIYVLRHCTITDMVHSGTPTLTVATIAGTSVAMIQRHYGHLTANESRDALSHLSF